MKQTKRIELLEMFLTGFIQVFFVGVNTFLIAKEVLLGIFFAAFTISWIWTWNVKKMAFGGVLDRIVYSLGAAFGSVLGVIFTRYLYKIFQ